MEYKAIDEVLENYEKLVEKYKVKNEQQNKQNKRQDARLTI
jgi:ribosome-associated translation inhibitor RaiA